jgi:hypothetical protein
MSAAELEAWRSYCIVKKKKKLFEELYCLSNSAKKNDDNGLNKSIKEMNQQRKSRFTAQPAVKPSVCSSQTKPKEKDYFDDDDEFDESLSKADSAPNDDYDPLDDFM